MVPMRIFLYYFDLLKDSSLVVTLTVSLGSLAVFRNYDKFSSAVSINHGELLKDRYKKTNILRIVDKKNFQSSCK